MSLYTGATAVFSAGNNNDVLTWWLASACFLAFLLSATAAVLVAAHQRKQRLPQAPHYRRHSPTHEANPPE